jgi:hypothetical protein
MTIFFFFFLSRLPAHPPACLPAYLSTGIPKQFFLHPKLVL